MNDILFIADLFAHQINGGGELSNQVLIEKLERLGNKITIINSHLLTQELLDKHSRIIVANFANLSDKMKKSISENKRYIIYEYDYKFLRSRDPSEFKNYLAPNDKIINRSFYERAKAVLCQTDFHVEIIKKNLNINNVFNLSGNLWSESHLETLTRMAKYPKKDVHAIMDSPISHKGTQSAVFYCERLGLKYELIESQNPKEFLEKLGQYEKLVFFPKTPETFSRIVAEARMMGMTTITTKNIGVIHEEWFSKKGLDLIEIIRYRQEEIINIVLRKLHE